MAEQDPTKWLPQEWPLFYNNTDTFESGNAGAEAQLEFTLNERPHHVYAVRFHVVYQLPDGFESFAGANETYPFLGFRKLMRDGGIDTGFTTTVELSQSNVTQKQTPVANIDSIDGTVRMYWPVPLRMRGGNTVTCLLRRDVAYPVITFGDPAVTFQVIPTIKGTLVTGQMLSDQFPAGPPGSTGVPA